VSRRSLFLPAAALAALALVAAPAATQTSTTTSQPTSTTVAAPKTGDKTSANGVTRVILGVAEPANAPGQTLLLQDIRIVPGAKLAQHYHQGTQLARVTKGTLTYSLDEGNAIVTKKGGSPETVTAPKTISLQPGDVLVENAGLLHHAENKGKTAVVLNLTALLQTGAPLATPAGTGATGTQLEISADLQSQSKLTRTVGAANDKTYGWNDLVGTATVDGQNVGVDLQGTVDYTSGSGPFGEFVTFTFADGSVLATRMQGAATAATGGATQFEATMSVVGGTGKYASTTGTGVFTGSRTGELGAPVQATFHLTLAG
jgi:quercetin dioxygenase-like cupin family protein